MFGSFGFNGFGFGLRAGGQGSGTPTPTPTPSAPMSSIAATGWQADYASTPSISTPVSFQALRPGYDSTGATTTYTDTLYVTQRTRQVYPNQASLTALTVSMSDFLLAADTITGATNNSTRVMPAPIVNWVMQSRRIVGNTVRLGVTGNHWAARNGKPFACVEFSVTDGTTTVTSKVAAMSVSTTGAADQFAVLAYETDIDISTLANPAQITCNAKVYPWVGTSASVADSSTGSGIREFSPRVFLRDTAKATSPNLVYVATGGNDTTAYVGTDPALAAASPALTPNGAVTRARTVLGTGAGALDGLRVRLTEGSWALTATPTASTVNVEIVVEPAPGAAKANTVYQIGAANFHLNATYIRFRGLTITRGGAFYLHNNTAGFCVVEDVTFNMGASTGALSSAAATFFWNGVTFPAAAGTALTAATVGQGMIRGCDFHTSLNNFHGKLAIGNKFRGNAVYAAGAFSQDNSIVQFNSFRGIGTANAIVQLATTLTGFSFSQNLVEGIHTSTSTPSLRPSSDSDLSSLTHVLFDNNTVAMGHFQAGRLNMFYDETVGTVRTHVFSRVRNTVAGGFYIKEDWFLGTNGNGSPNPTDAPNHIGNWAQLYGAGFFNNLTLFAQPGTNTVGQNEGQAYPGLGSSIATSNTVPQVSLADGVNFTTWRATTTNSTTAAAVAGTGDGDYTLPSGSALIGRATAADEVFPLDLAGNPRDRGSIGAYR